MLGYNEHKYAVGNLEVINEFDTRSFQANAVSYLKNDIKDLNFKTSYYSKTIAETVDSLSDIKLDKEAVREFAKITTINGVLPPIRPIDYSDVTVINASLLTGYVNSVKSLVDNIISGSEVSKDEALNVIKSANYVKKNIVKTTLNYNTPINDIIASSDNVKKIIPDKKYITSTVLPFVNGFEKTRANLINEGKEFLLIVTNTEGEINKIIAQVNNYKTINKKLDYIEYNGLYNIIDLTSYVTYMYIRKVNNFRTNMLNCNRLYSDALNVNSLNESTTVTAGINTGVMSTTPANLGFSLLQGNVAAYEVLANKVYELYTGKNKVDAIDDVVRFGDDVPNMVNGQYTQGIVSYNRSVYDEIKKAFIGVGQALYNICQIPDGLMIRKDDIIEGSGFKIPLKDRFRGKLNDINDISKIQMTDFANRDRVDLANVNELLAEVHDFGRNMQEISDEAIAAKAILEEISHRFDKNINNEFKDVDSVKKISEWAEMFSDEYIDFVNDVCGRFMERLAHLAITLKNIDDTMSSNKNPEDVVAKAFSMFDVTDYTEGVTKDYLEYLEDLNHVVFNAMEAEYQIARIDMLTGHNLILEADDNTQKPNQKASFVGGFSASLGNAIENLKLKIKKWFEDTAAKFKNNVSALANNDTVKNITQNAGLIQSYDFSQVPAAEIYPYEVMPVSELARSIESLTNNIKNFKPQDIQAITDEAKATQMVLSFINGLNPSADTNTQMLNYTIHKSPELPQKKAYQGNELKTYVTNVMLPFENDYTRGNTTTENAISNVYKELEALADRCKTVEPSTIKNNITNTNQNQKVNTQANTQQNNQPQVVAASDSFVEPGFTYLEADNPNTQNNMGKVVGWIDNCARNYCGVVRNSLGQRHKDYVIILSPIVNAAIAAQNNQQNQTNT